MRKKMEEMTREEILKEFEGATEHGRVRRPKKMIPLTIRVHPNLVKDLDAQAQRRGVSGHTTMARMILESSVNARPHSFADEVAEKVVAKLNRRKIAKGHRKYA